MTSYQQKRRHTLVHSTEAAEDGDFVQLRKARDRVRSNKIFWCIFWGSTFIERSRESQKDGLFKTLVLSIVYFFPTTFSFSSKTVPMIERQTRFRLDLVDLHVLEDLYLWK